jgi:hypothetical protein
LERVRKGKKRKEKEKKRKGKEGKGRKEGQKRNTLDGVERANVANDEPNDVFLKRLDERFRGSSSKLDLHRIEQVENGGTSYLCTLVVVLPGPEFLPMGSVLCFQVLLERGRRIAIRNLLGAELARVLAVLVAGTEQTPAFPRPGVRVSVGGPLFRGRHIKEYILNYLD